MAFRHTDVVVTVDTERQIYRILCGMNGFGCREAVEVSTLDGEEVAVRLAQMVNHSMLPHRGGRVVKMVPEDE